MLCRGDLSEWGSPPGHRARLDVPMEVLNRAIETRGGGKDGRVLSSEGLLNHRGEEAISFGEDGAHESSSVVGLDSDLGGIKTVPAQVIEAQGYELGRVEAGELVSITDESSSGHDVFDAVLELGQDTA